MGSKLSFLVKAQDNDVATFNYRCTYAHTFGRGRVPVIFLVGNQAVAPQLAYASCRNDAVFGSSGVTGTADGNGGTITVTGGAWAITIAIYDSSLITLS